MDNQSELQTNDTNNVWGFSVGLLIVRGFISRLVSLFSITQQDLIDAGVYLQRMRD